MTSSLQPADGLAGDTVSLQARLSLALEAAQMGLWDWDIVTGRLVWDDRSAALYGTTVTASSGTIADVDTRVHPDDLRHVRTVLEGAIESVGTVDVEFRVVWPDGSVRWLYGRGQAIPDDVGRTIRVIGTNVDVTDARRAVRQQEADAQRRAGLVAVAQTLAEARSERDVLEVVTREGAALLGAQGTVLCLAQGEGQAVRALSTSFFDESVQTEVAELPSDFPLPMIDAAVNAAAHFLRDREAAVALFPGALELYERARTQGSATVPLRARGQLLGSLSVAFGSPFDWRPPERELLEAFAALTAQALDRLLAREAEQQAVLSVKRMAETMQRSLLTSPQVPAGVSVAVRYQPAAEQAQVGGDWYDAFLTPDGNSAFVIGDVAGHDQDAAAEMAQVRNITRGVAQSITAPPAAILTALDKALDRLGLSTLATAVFCQLHPAPGGGRMLLWSNAGHPPPLLVDPDGTAELLSADPDLLLGIDPDGGRADHRRLLRPGSTVVLFTDGLVERRSQDVTQGLERLVSAARGLHGLQPEDLCDALLASLGATSDTEDDIAMLALHLPVVGPAGPGRSR